jgi:hypothetical protein
MVKLPSSPPLPLILNDLKVYRDQVDRFHRAGDGNNNDQRLIAD